MLFVCLLQKRPYYLHSGKDSVPRKYLEKQDTSQNDEDPFGPTFRKLYFKEEEIDTREHSEKVKDKFAEAGNDTRNANQFVKFVNAHIQNKVSHLEKIKEAQRKFEEELNMFSSGTDVPVQKQSKQDNTNSDVENALIIRQLSAMINKYGIEKMSKALDQILAGKQ
ncbi:hypothetical protein NITUZ_30269 [Candidatus Nitrosotenuis uzonensis]|uniref:Uncharacterized protein n=1 Tax=Candidatus Nitrosotenuis uzonensis TaxID=1407055 RepID=V6ASF3_9ARCH|nr:hypothetical protein NITUZ_30269 [Candidatus Nitrosotenuis uzonensis]